tara:strand:+ start:1510 stop:1905 length:396 start_codon:yes stop_codon:yes gene_type:complete
MRTYNRITILGHMTRDPETIASNNGWCKLGVTTNSGWGEKSKPQHHNITVFDDKKTDFIMKYIKKGMIVFVAGEVQYNKGNDDKWYTSIIVGNFDSAVELCEKKSNTDPYAVSNEFKAVEQNEINDDDIPF